MMSDETLLYGCTMAASAGAAVVVFPWVSRLWLETIGRLEHYHQGKIVKTTRALDDIFMDVKPRWLNVGYLVVPLVFASLALVVTKNPWLAGTGSLVGLLLPDIWIKSRRAIRRRKFEAQLVDALFILSSSLRAGLSLPQAFEQLEAEMTPPASQEFGLMIKAHRLGRTLEGSLQGLNDRMPCQDLNLITTAVLVARETGGDITNVITQLINTIRERKKLHDKVKTLTLQGRMQAYIMSLLPLAFAFFVRTFNPHYLDIMFNDPTGQALLILAVGLWVMGMILLGLWSKVDI